MSFYIKLAKRVERWPDLGFGLGFLFARQASLLLRGRERGRRGVVSRATTQYRYFAPSFHCRTVIGVLSGLGPGSGSRTAWYCTRTYIPYGPFLL